MMTSEFINKAMANKQTLQHINISALKPAEMELHLDAKCVCCGGDVEIMPVEECNDYGDHIHMDVIGWACDLFCDGCSDHIPVDVLYKYGAISKEECDMILNCDVEYPHLDCNEDTLPF